MSPRPPHAQPRAWIPRVAAALAAVVLLLLPACGEPAQPDPVPVAPPTAPSNDQSPPPADADTQRGAGADADAAAADRAVAQDTTAGTDTAADTAPAPAQTQAPAVAPDELDAALERIDALFEQGEFLDARARLREISPMLSRFGRSHEAATIDRDLRDALTTATALAQPMQLLGAADQRQYVFVRRQFLTSGRVGSILLRKVLRETQDHDAALMAARILIDADRVKGPDAIVTRAAAHPDAPVRADILTHAARFPQHISAQPLGKLFEHVEVSFNPAQIDLITFFGTIASEVTGSDKDAFDTLTRPGAYALMSDMFVAIADSDTLEDEPRDELMALLGPTFAPPLDIPAIGLNFTAGEARNALKPDESAGPPHLAQRHWNNLPNSGEDHALHDAKGHKTTVTAKWGSFYPRSTSAPADSPDHRIMRGFLRQHSDAGRIQIAGLNPDWRYTVVYYMDFAAERDDQGIQEVVIYAGDERLASGRLEEPNQGTEDKPNYDFAGRFVQATDENSHVGNYRILRDIAPTSDGTLIIESRRIRGDGRAGLSALQLIPTAYDAGVTDDENDGDPA